MISRAVRRVSPRLLAPLLAGFERARITPNQLTLAGLALCIVSGILIAISRLPEGAAALMLAGLLDATDGELARRMRQDEAKSRLGGFIDSIADHYGDFAVYFGFAWRAVWQNDSLTLLLVIAAMFGSLIGSQVRSRAGMLGIDTKNVGAFTRFERVAVILIGLVTGWVAPALAVLAAATNFSALQRVLYSLKNMPSSGGEPEP